MTDDRKTHETGGPQDWKPAQDGAPRHDGPDHAAAQAACGDEFDQLFTRFTATTAEATARPDPARRMADLALAAENFAKLQDARDDARLTVTAPKAGLWQGVRHMLQNLTSRGVLTVTTAVVAGGILVLSPQGRALLTPPTPQLQADLPPLTAPETVAEKIPVTAGAAGGMAAQMAEPAVPQALPTEGQSATAYLEMAPAQARVAADEVVPMPLPAPMTRVAPMQTMPAAPAQESYANAPEAGVMITQDNPVSTFSVDVDTASWSLLRQSLNMGQLPPPEALRIEEMVNYFPYDYAGPAAGDPAPFAAHLALMETPWNPDTQLLRIGLQGEMPALDPRPALNLVFLIDTSGSMEDPAKLPLLKSAFRLLLDSLSPMDEVAIVTYAGDAGVALPPTKADDRATILAAIDSLGAGGGTAGAAGLAEAYALADSMRAEGEISRVMLATDGDFNIGPADPADLTRLITKARAGGSYLSVLGFGRGNLNDAVMQSLAQNGNGTAAYIDTLSEAQKVLGGTLSGALFPIADDVKVQIEFNPALIAEYRLIGYETRALDRQDFNNDRVDAGEIGAGHAVTALYEVTPVGSPAVLADPLRYAAPAAADTSGEIGFLRLRWKEPGSEISNLWEMPLPAEIGTDPEAAFAAAIAGFGQILKGGLQTGAWNIGDALELAQANLGDDPYGYRQEALRLMQLAQSLRGE